MKKLLLNWKTTLIGIITIVLSVLLSSEVITVGQSEQYNIVFNQLIENAELFIASIAGVVLLFSKDADNKN